MYIYVPAVGRSYTLIATHVCIDYSHIGLGTAYKEMDGQILPVAAFADQCSGVFAVGIHTIALRLFKISLSKSFQNSGVAAFAVVIIK
jgi:hypothetical protein